MDTKLARWLAGEAESDDAVETGIPTAAAGADFDFQNYSGDAIRADVASLTAALRAAEDRANALETDNRELEADLYAASVLWAETEAENQSLSVQVGAFRAEAERAVAAAAAAAVEPLMGPLRWGCTS
jgi:hypothetical protein